jgi:hypothetical protein
MYRIVLALLLITFLAPITDARDRTSTRSARSSTPRTTRTAKRSAPRTATKCSSCTRESRGRIARSATAKHDFQKSHPCPATGKTSGACPGYVIDHVVPLKRGARTRRAICSGRR